MQILDNDDRYGLISTLLHWLTAALVVGLFGFGLWMTSLSYYDPWYRTGPWLHKDFLDVEKYPTAHFVSTAYEPKGEGKAVLKGDLTLHGVTKPVAIDVEHIGAGPDPWGGQRRGFAGTTTLTLKDFGIDYDLGPAARQVELFLSVEGIQK